MTFNKAQVARRAFDPAHRKLMDAVRVARGGDRLKAIAELKAYVTGRLAQAAKARKAA